MTPTSVGRLRSLQHAAGFLQSKVAARLQTRFTPTLAFKLDEGVKKSIEISRLISEALESDRPEASPTDTPVEGDSDRLEQDEPEQDDDPSPTPD